MKDKTAFILLVTSAAVALGSGVTLIVLEAQKTETNDARELKKKIALAGVFVGSIGCLITSGILKSNESKGII